MEQLITITYDDAKNAIHDILHGSKVLSIPLVRCDDKVVNRTIENEVVDDQVSNEIVEQETIDEPDNNDNAKD
ncbi:hypothetical protein ACI65C_006162 [Semiaphis heraclei]